MRATRRTFLKVGVVSACVLLTLRALDREVFAGIDTQRETQGSLDLKKISNKDAEVEELLSLLTFGLTRRFVAGVSKPWAEATEQDVTNFLHSWRHSRFTLLQQGYQALARVIVACWYGNPLSWGAIGYDGPPFGKELGLL